MPVTTPHTCLNPRHRTNTERNRIAGQRPDSGVQKRVTAEMKARAKALLDREIDFINHDEFYYFSFLFLLLFVMSAILQMALVVAKQNQNRHKE